MSSALNASECTTILKHTMSGVCTVDLETNADLTSCAGIDQCDVSGASASGGSSPSGCASHQKGQRRSTSAATHCLIRSDRSGTRTRS
jgi:hypothetical protein